MKDGKLTREIRKGRNADLRCGCERLGATLGKRPLSADRSKNYRQCQLRAQSADTHLQRECRLPAQEYAYADDLFSLNFPKDYKGADRLRVKTFVNQIGQIPIPVALGLGDTILPKSGVNAFSRKQDLAIIELPQRRYHDLWIISRKGRSDIARVAAMSTLIDRAAQLL